MKQLSLFFALLLACPAAWGQIPAQAGLDCNPRLNDAETAFLSQHFSASRFDFKQKTIGFATWNGRALPFISFSNGLLPDSKKAFFALLRNDTRQQLVTRLRILTEEEKLLTWGFDAIVVVVDKKFRKQLAATTLKPLITTFSYRELNYPANLNHIGTDTSAALTKEDAAFLNTIYHYKRSDFNFSHKKVAFLGGGVYAQDVRSDTKQAYFNRISTHLQHDFLYPTGQLYVLTSDEKAASGGYDAIIVERCKRCPKSELVKKLGGRL